MTIARAIKVGPGVLTLGVGNAATDISHQCTNTVLTPTVEFGEDIPVLSGGEIPGDRIESWELSGALAQDTGFPQSVVDWCFDNRGHSMPFEFVPASDPGGGWAGVVRVEAVAVGGDVRTKPTADFVWPLIGSPRRLNRPAVRAAEVVALEVVAE